MRLAFPSALAVAAALVFVGPVRAHVDVSPTFLPEGGRVIFSLTGHNDRDEPMTGFAITVPTGLSIVGGEPVGDWSPRIDGDTVTWTGGSLAPDEDMTFDVELEASAEPGPAELVVEQLYPGAALARWPVRLTVVPATVIPSEETEAAVPWWAIGVLAVLATAALALLTLFLLTRRRASSA